MKLVFLGPPGAGKGTQAEKVCAALSIPHISTGDILRAAVREGTPVGLAAKGYMDQGGLVPDDVIIALVEERLKLADCAAGYLFDGFPRTIEQAKALAKITSLDAVVDIDVPDESIVKRLSGRRVCPKCAGTFHLSMLNDSNVCPTCGAALIQRPDDNEATVQNRLNVYHSQTAPLIDFYRAEGLLKTVDGSQPLEEVFQCIMHLLER